MYPDETPDADILRFRANGQFSVALERALADAGVSRDQITRYPSLGGDRVTITSDRETLARVQALMQEQHQLFRRA